MDLYLDTLFDFGCDGFLVNLAYHQEILVESAGVLIELLVNLIFESLTKSLESFFWKAVTTSTTTWPWGVMYCAAILEEGV